ncbi:hypothetical protein ACQKNO_24520 [Bacillus paramycoides]|uniref:hypothetical protein n=1 Tax=Bacillus paramycoides TaxID=2026194 RepID=UPI003CFFFEB0
MSLSDDYLWENAMLDTDFALKMEKVRKINAIEEYIPKLVGHLYIHHYVYENEILVPRRVKEQIDKLVFLGRATIVDAETIKKEDPVSAMLYQQSIHLLETSDPDTRENGKNWGETVSVAYAHIKGIRYILSDEKSLQEVIDDKINSGSENDIKVVRLVDFICGMKEKNLSRKDAFAIWNFAHQDKDDPKKLEWAKSVFRENLWPFTESLS